MQANGRKRRDRISAEVTDPSRSKSSSIRQITQSRTFTPNGPALGSMSSCLAVTGSILDSFQPVAARPTWAPLGWDEIAPVPYSLGKQREQIKAGGRLLLSSPATGLGVDMIHVACVWCKECELIPKSESNSKGSLWEEDSIYILLACAGSLDLSHLTYVLKKVRALRCRAVL